MHITPNKKVKKAQFETPKPLVDGLEEILALTESVGTLQDENASLIVTLKKQKTEMNNLRIEVEKHKFGLERFAASDDDIHFYTGFPNYNTFKSFYDFLLPAATQLNYWGSTYSDSRDEQKRGFQRKIQPIDELFIVLYRLRCDALEKDIADIFGVSVSTVSRILNTWINLLYHTLKQLPIWPSAKVIKDTTPKCF